MTFTKHLSEQAAGDAMASNPQQTIPGLNLIGGNRTPPPIPTETEPKYAGFTRFEIELEVRTPLHLRLTQKH